MNAQKDTTEDKILDAATEIFLVKGMDGARMQEIADKANINKALLHYYFRSKEKLFDAILTKIVSFAFPKIGKVFESDLPFPDKLDQVIDIYISMLLKHPQFPSFLIKEMNRKGSVLFQFIDRQHVDIQPIYDVIEDAMDKGEIIRMNSRHLIINVLGMCVFPFAVQPMIKNVAFNGGEDQLLEFLNERKTEVKKFVMRALQPE
ncbi:TetR/AcrR family transcriptional regulator [Sunxiuqinia sp. A32]|uniref:TetR/AcrR family transcriptional regulator n=1 Tax=Sunxiuqinia sp. A32 TaxID=3461496 RepID=UPI004046175C